MPQAFFRHLGIWGCLFIFKAVKHCSEALRVCCGTCSWLGTSLTGLLSETLSQDAVVYSVVLIAFPREDLCGLLSVDTWRALEWDAGSSIESRSQLPTLLEGTGVTGSLYTGHKHLVGALSCIGISARPPPQLRDISKNFLDCLCCHSKDNTSP